VYSDVLLNKSLISFILPLPPNIYELFDYYYTFFEDFMKLL